MTEFISGLGNLTKIFIVLIKIVEFFGKIKNSSNHRGKFASVSMKPYHRNRIIKANDLIKKK